MWFAFEVEELSACAGCPIAQHETSRGILIKRGHCELLMRDVKLTERPDDCPLVEVDGRHVGEVSEVRGDTSCGE